MTPDQQKFKDFIEQHYPAALQLFDFNKRELLVEKLESYLSVASHSEQIMSRFFAAVWLHKNRFEFDFIDAAKTLDQKHLKVITSWLNTPVWP